MITKEKRIEKICSFYASDYHLEMIMIPYINKKLDEKTKVIIVTERDLTETINTVISKVNLPKERKSEILNINWDNSLIDNDIIKENQEVVIFVVGKVNFINEKDSEIVKIINKCSIKIINCYNIEEVQNCITEIVLNHSKVLNTREEKELDENY